MPNVYRVLDPGRYDSGHAHGPFYFIPGFLVGALPPPAYTDNPWREHAFPPLQPPFRFRSSAVSI